MKPMVEWISPLPHFLHLTANQTVVVLVLRPVKLWKRWEEADYSARLGLFIASIHTQEERMREASHLKRRWGPSEANVMWVDPLCHITWSAALAILRLQLGAIVQCHYSWISSFPIYSKLSLSYRFYFYAVLGSYRCISQHALQSPGCLTRFKVVEVPWQMWSLFRTIWKWTTASLCSAQHFDCVR